MVDYIDGCPYNKPSLHPRDEAYVIMVNDLSICSWIHFAMILLSIFASMFIREIGLRFSFLVGCLCGLGTKVIVASKNELGSVPSDSILWNILESFGIRSSINV